MILKALKSIKRKAKRLLQNSQEKRHSLVGPSHLWKMKQDFQINFLQSQGLQKTDKLLDIGCGTLRGGVPIIEFLNDKNYYGIEVREEVLAEGKKELETYKLEHKNPNLISFDNFSDIELNEKMDVMFAFSVLIHLDDEIANNCFEFVSKYLSENGVFFANVNIESHQDGNWQGFPVVFRTLGFYEELARKNGLNLKTIGDLKDLGHDSGQELADKQIMLEIRKF